MRGLRERPENNPPATVLTLALARSDEDAVRQLPLLGPTLLLAVFLVFLLCALAAYRLSALTRRAARGYSFGESLGCRC